MSENVILKPGAKLGKYRIERHIGGGTRTAVYQAWHPNFKHGIVLKTLHAPADRPPDTDQCFRREAQAIQQLKHPNIIRVYDFGIEGDVYYLVMEFVAGNTLRDLISARPTGLDKDTVLRLFGQIASAVAAAHDQGIAHGNIKPDNVLLDDSQRPVLTDFRTPCQMRSADDDKPTYLAPEQLSAGETTPASDVYMLGIVLYEMVTGLVPFRGGTYDAIAAQHLHDAPTPPCEIAVGLSPRIERAILKGLNKNPADRHLSARDMLNDLERQESFNQYETLSLNRDAADEVRKRQSEIMRFEHSRADLPAFKPEQAEAPTSSSGGGGSSPLPVVIAAVVLVAAVSVALIILLA